MRGSAIVVVAAWACAACDPIANADYVGAPMITLTGTFASSADDPVGGVALMWQDSVGAAGPGVVATALPVSIDFPATFHIQVPVPPPDSARFSFDDGGPALGEAYIYVVQDPSAAQLVPLGLERTHVLVYADGDVGPGTLAADYLGESLGAGYHLRHFAPVATPGAAQQALIDRCTANGDPAAACQVRRGYQLAPIADDDPLQIAVSSQ
jgi:hypothetical protein